MGGIEAGGVFAFYRYSPSIPCAVVCLALFGLFSGLHAYQMVRTRTWIMIPFVIGATCEWVGYVGRILSSTQSPNYTVGPYLLQGMLILWGPMWFAASIYICFGRLVRLTGGQPLSFTRSSTVTIIFICCDYFGLIIQGIGSGIMAAGTLADYYTGTDIVVVGLAVLVASFSFFMFLTGRFHFKADKGSLNKEHLTLFTLQHHLLAIHAASILILIRSCGRLAEYAQGNAGWLMGHEWFFYAFDSAPMLFVLAIMSAIHPSQINAALHGGTYSTQMGFHYRSIAWGEAR